MKKVWRISLLSAINTAMGYVVFWILPGLFLIAFNQTKAPGNNPDGEILVPLGWFLIAIMPIICVFVNGYLFYKLLLTKKYIFWALIFFAVGAVIGILVVNRAYSVNYTNLISSIIKWST